MYDLQVRLRTRVSYELSAEEIARYKAMIAGLLAEIDDGIILAQRNIYTENKLYALALKAGVSITDLRRSLRIEPDAVYHNDLVVRSLLRGQKLVIEFLELENDSLRVEGHVTSVIENSSVSVAFNVDGRLIEASLIDRPERRRFSLDERIHDAVGFVAVIPLEESQTVTPVLRLRDVEVEPVLVYGTHARLTETMKTSYFSAEGWFVSRRGTSGLHVCRDTRPLSLLRRERRYLKELVEQKHRKDLARYRVFCRLLKPLLLGRRVWIVSDRIMMARDNGEAFFRFLQKRRTWRVLPYFALSPESVDHAKLDRVGRLVDYGSAKYRLLALLSDAIISSAADDHVTNVFDEDDIYMKDLFAFKFVVLQHGITQSDQSMWLNRYRKNIRILVTSAASEYESIVGGSYYYSSREVKLTGLPRHERLLASRAPVEKKILIMPTWRKRLAGALDRSTGLRARYPGFTDSEYYRFYNALVSDPVLLDALRTRGYSLKFIMHPMLIQEAGEFTASDVVSIETNCDYSYEFLSACLMVTDYSSVAFDFALLNKPVIYAQFDRETLIANHIMADGYFSHEEQGFGPVCASYEQTIAAILGALDADCTMQEPYRSRASAFFPKGELSSCESIYRAILDA
jgi:CDP-glycerol glycerophosphotransferase (TagB/SpsB family)